MDEEEAFMRKPKNTLIVLGIFIVLLGTYFAVTKKPVEPAESDSSKDIEIIHAGSEDVTQVILGYEDGALTMEKTIEKKEDGEEEEKWVVTSPGNFKSDSAKLKSVADKLSILDAQKVLDENASDLAQYGFDKPFPISVKMETWGKDIEIGNLTPSKDAYYVKEKGSNKVYTVGKYSIDSVKVDKNTLRDNTVFEIKSDQVTALSIYRGEKLSFTVRKTGEEEWNITAPVEEKGDKEKIEDLVSDVTYNYTFEEYIEDKPQDLEKYGLANPSYKVDIETAEGVKSILLGHEKEKGKTIYAKIADEDYIFTFSLNLMNYLDKPVSELVGQPQNEGSQTESQN